MPPGATAGWWLTYGAVAGVRAGQLLGLGFGLSPDGYGMGGLGGSYAGTSTAGGYSIGFVTGSAGSFDRVDRLEEALRGSLGLPPGAPSGESSAQPA